MRIEIHVLQNFAPSNLNRDDTGSPKDAEFGGYRRARISSQCQKRAVRNYFENHNLIPAANRAERTKRLRHSLETPKEKGRDKTALLRAVTTAVSAFRPKSEDKEEHGRRICSFSAKVRSPRFADVADQHRTPSPMNRNAEPTPPRKRPRKRQGGTTKPPIPKVQKPCQPCSTAARRPTSLSSAECSPTCPRTTSTPPARSPTPSPPTKSTRWRWTTSPPWMTLSEDTAGADMIGTVEFNSACFYRFATLDVSELVGGDRDEKKTRPFGLQGDAELARTTASAFLTAFIHAIPTGKQNSFAAHNPPSLVFAIVRDGPPVSLANAFVKPSRRETAKPGGEVHRSAWTTITVGSRHVRHGGLRVPPSARWKASLSST